MRARALGPVALTLTALLAACAAEEPTRLVVEIDADRAVRAAVESVRLRVIGSRADEPDETRSVFDERRSVLAADWPARTTIVPADGDARRTLRVEALVHDAGGQMIAEVRALTGFVAGETRVLRLRFDASCVGMLSCADGETCVDGSCRSAVVDPRSLPALEDPAGELDAGGTADAGAPGDDGSTDAGADAGADACASVASYADEDGDGWGDAATITTACTVPADRVARGGDCDDACPTCHPAGAERCDGSRDEDCDGTTDEGCACAMGSTRACPAGSDEGACVAGEQTCIEGMWGVCAGRVDPVAEDCDGADDDCDGRVDEALRRACGSDVGACRRGTESCAMGAWGACTATMPRAEACNGADDDCDGTVDEGVLRTFFRDADADTYGDDAATSSACTAPSGYVARGGDCDDGCRLCRPGGTETCDGSRDEDCDGTADEGCGCTTGASRACLDGIDTGLCRAGTQLCVAGAWGVCTGQVAPAPEACNAQDDDCDARIDEELTQACGPMTEMGVCRRGTQSCSAGVWGVCRGAVMPGTETCNGLDDDCDGSIDEGVRTTFYADGDGDGYGVATSMRQDCVRPPGYAARSGDCDDARASVHPGATETCDGIDQDCDGTTDEGAGCMPDAGPPDAGPPDAGPPDAGAPPPDAG